MPADKGKIKSLQDTIALGESAVKALRYFEGWIDKKKSSIVGKMASSSNEDAVLAMWRELKLLDQLKKDLNTDIQSGQLAMDELEEELDG